jgi:hypothetical protein
MQPTIFLIKIKILIFLRRIELLTLTIAQILIMNVTETNLSPLTRKSTLLGTIDTSSPYLWILFIYLFICSLFVCMYVFIYLLQMDPSPVAELLRH